MSGVFPGFDRNKLLSFDLETTGPDPATARIVTSALVRIHGSEVSTKTWLADPGIAIPAEATAVHGITTEQARAEGRDHDEVAAETAAAILRGWTQGYTLVVFNASFDLTILQRFASGFDIRGPILDPYVIDRAVDQYRKGKRTLTALCDHYGVPLDNAHDATQDALGAARLAWKLADAKNLHARSWEGINELQAQWHADRQRSLAAYFARQGRSTTVATDWPIRK